MSSPYQASRFSIAGSPGDGEPMTLGSPVSSPIRNGQMNSSFLPSYLMQEAQIHASPNTSTVANWNSPPFKQTPTNNSFMSSQFSPIPSGRYSYRSPAMNHMNEVLNSSGMGKSVGPPVQDLFDAVESPLPSSSDVSKLQLDKTPKTPVTPFRIPGSQQQYANLSTMSKSFGANNTNTSFIASPAQIDPFYTQGEQLTMNTSLDETWVTIFGFPPAATNFILQQFSQYGTITEQKLQTNGNWLHIRYQSKLQAKKALSKNGKVFSNNIMVGVKPCIEMSLMNDTIEKENFVSDINSSNFCDDSIDKEILDASRHSLRNVRPLTVSNLASKTKSPNSEKLEAKTEKKANSFVSKAMEYVLKW